MDTPLSSAAIDALINTETLYQQAPCGYLSFLPDGTIIRINQTLLGWLGYTEPELQANRKFVDLISKGGRMHYELFFRPLITVNANVQELSYELGKKDGSTLAVLMNARAVKDPEGNLQAVHLAVFENTQRKSYEKELLLARQTAEEERKRFAFLADLIPEIIWTAEPSGRLNYVNERFFQYFGITDRSLEGLSWFPFVHPRDRQRIMRRWVHSIRTGELFEAQVRLAQGNDRFEWHQFRAVPYRDDQGNLVRWFGSSSSIDGHVKAMQRKDDFINTASHELKTPITALRMYQQLLERAALAEPYNGLVKKTGTAINNLQFLVTSLLDVSIINSGRLSLTVTRFSLTETVRACVEQQNMSQTSHQIVLQVPGDAPFFIAADRERIIQVINNLLNNAVKYSPGASKVMVRMQGRAGAVLVEVEDYGMGIAPEKLATIFDKYYRVDSQAEHNPASGLGLGLYIIQNILQQHQSAIVVRSEVGKGSVFAFTLPLPD